MRLSDMSKKALLGNCELMKYCQESGIDLNKLNKCNIEKMDNIYVFVLNKENIPISNRECQLDIDIATQPDIVLKMEYAEDGNWVFNPTKHTLRVLTT